MSAAVDQYISNLDHPLIDLISHWRLLLKKSFPHLNELIKWNAPSYSLGAVDCFTFNLPPKKEAVQLVLHRGAKAVPHSERAFIDSESKLLIWKDAHRAVIRFASLAELQEHQEDLLDVLSRWIDAIERSSAND